MAYKHGSLPLVNCGCARDYDSIKSFFSVLDIEGIVWHHPDGRMAKIKKSDFGLPRKPVSA